MAGVLWWTLGVAALIQGRGGSDRVCFCVLTAYLNVVYKTLQPLLTFAHRTTIVQNTFL